MGSGHFVGRRKAQDDCLSGWAFSTKPEDPTELDSPCYCIKLVGPARSGKEAIARQVTQYVGLRLHVIECDRPMGPAVLPEIDALCSGSGGKAYLLKHVDRLPNESQQSLERLIRLSQTQRSMSDEGRLRLSCTITTDSTTHSATSTLSSGLAPLLREYVVSVDYPVVIEHLAYLTAKGIPERRLDGFLEWYRTKRSQSHWNRGLSFDEGLELIQQAEDMADDSTVDSLCAVAARLS